jgi:hypothetical protein
MLGHLQHRNLRGMKLAGVIVAALAVTGVAAAKTTLPGVVTPSGNIRCFVTRVLHCDIKQANYRPQLQARCIAPPNSLDWHGWDLPPAGKARVTCAGGILYDPVHTRLPTRRLPYGQTWRHGPYTCTSRVTGLTCTNRTGHGLFISRESWRAF